MNRIRVQIIDDEPKAIHVVEELLKEHRDIDVVARSTSVSEGLGDHERTEPELVFLDIKIKSETGFDFLNQLEKQGRSPRIIFTTGYDQFAIQAIKKSAFDYIMKPIQRDELKTALDRYRESLVPFVRSEGVPDRLRINTRTGFLLIDPNEIVYLQADGNYTRVIISNSEEEISTKNLGFFEEVLKGHFTRISRSVIINHHMLFSVNRQKKEIILLKNGESYKVNIPERSFRVIG